MKNEILYQDSAIVVINKPGDLGCPIVGDSLYGSGNEGEQMMLHASFLQFIHPETAITVKLYTTPPI